ncbi:MAG: CDP-glycerol glycerophosphotransferase family protein [bacterium]|nr:CDP-glycerol glycerophosphotransferase family protein [bacterium]
MNKKELLVRCFQPLSWLNRIIPKRKEQIFFYSNLRFSDNARALYEYMVEQGYHRRYRIVLSLNTYDEYKDNAPKGVKVVGNKLGILYFLRSKYAFYSFGKYPIYPGKGQCVVNLWHGMPLKKIGNLEAGCEKVNYNYFSYVLATSKLFAGIMPKVFGCTEDQVMCLGQPRCDWLFKKGSNLRKICHGAKKMIVWLPTFRDLGDDYEQKGMFLEMLENGGMERLNDYVKALDAFILIKIHPLQKITKPYEYTYSNIVILREEEVKDISLYEILSVSDALITDYSSVYFDYLLVDRPIGFTVDDQKMYEKIRGYIFENPSIYMPGQQIHNMIELKNFIRNASQGPDLYRSQRHKINDLVNEFKDGDFCKQVLTAFHIT